MKQFIIHVGLPKCASTFLQREIFPKLEEIEIYGANNQMLHIWSQFRDDKINLLTDENFLGCPIKIKNLNADKKVLIDRLNNLFPDAKIIIIIRNKDKWLWSLYKEYIKTGGIEEYNDFCMNWLIPNYTNFEETISILKKRFKEVLVLQYTDLKRNSNKFVKDICDFIGTEVPDYDKLLYNKSIRDNEINKYIFFNRIFKTKYNNKGILPMYMNPAFQYQYLLRKYKNGQ